MEKKQITANDVANALINVSKNIGISDEKTAIGLKTSKKKDILKSDKEYSFSNFTEEIKKRQIKKDWRDMNDDD